MDTFVVREDHYVPMLQPLSEFLHRSDDGQRFKLKKNSLTTLIAFGQQALNKAFGNSPNQASIFPLLFKTMPPRPQ